MRISDWSSDVCSSDLFRRTVRLNQSVFSPASYASRTSGWVGMFPTGPTVVEKLPVLNPRLSLMKPRTFGSNLWSSETRHVGLSALVGRTPSGWLRSDESRVGKEWVSTCRYRWPAYK